MHVSTTIQYSFAQMSELTQHGSNEICKVSKPQQEDCSANLPDWGSVILLLSTFTQLYILLNWGNVG